MKLTTFFIIAILILALGAAFILYAKTNQPKIVIFNSEFPLQLEDVAYFPSQNLSIKLLEISQDSRCPSDVQCIWQGEAVLSLSIQKNDSQQIFSLSTVNSPFKNVFGYNITLLSVEPYPISTRQIDKADYAAEFNITKTL